MACRSASRVRYVGAGAAALFALSGCSNKPSGPAGAAAGAGGASPAAASASAGQADRAGAGGAGGAEGEGAPLLALVRTWDAALNARDAEALRPVYGASVRFYGRDLAREAALGVKRAALAKPYAQALGAVRLDRPDPARWRARFDKRWTGPGGAAGEVEAVLVFANEGGRWVVVEETDAKTEARRPPAGESCEDAVIDVVAATAPARALLEGPTDPAHGHRSNGLRLGSTPPESPTFAVAVHETHDSHLVTFAWFEVDPKTGAVRQSMPDERAVPAPPELAAKVRAACAGR